MNPGDLAPIQEKLLELTPQGIAALGFAFAFMYGLSRWYLRPLLATIEKLGEVLAGAAVELAAAIRELGRRG